MQKEVEELRALKKEKGKKKKGAVGKGTSTEK